MRWNVRAMLAAVGSLSLAFPLRAAAQPAPTAAAAVAKPSGTAAAPASASAAPASSASAAPASSAGALPPGHPTVGQPLPSGHPPVGANPHAGASRGDMAGLFQPPEDVVQDDASVPPGVLVVAVQDADGRPVPGVTIDLDILRSSVAKGDSRERITKQADDAGTFRFEGLTIGAGTSYVASVTRGGGTFSLSPFALGAEAGKRAVLHVYETSPNLEDLLVGTQGIVFLQLRQDAIAVEQLFQVYNLGRVAWLPDATFALPEDYKAFNKAESDDQMRFEEVKGTGVALRGTVSPGRHDGNFRWQVPFEQKERQTIRIELPPRMAQLRVMAEASKSMTLDVAGFPAAQRTQNREGKKILITEKQASRADGGLRVIEITLGGLPTPSNGRWVALGMAGVTVIGAVFYALRKRDDRTLDDDARQDLLEARDALLDEFVELERARKRGDIGPKTYQRVRTALLDALARIVTMIESAPQPEASAGAGKTGGALKARSPAAPRP